MLKTLNVIRVCLVNPNGTRAHTDHPSTLTTLVGIVKKNKAFQQKGNIASVLKTHTAKERVWPGIEPGTSRKLCCRVFPKRESYH
jgi:hypothetical protein